MENYQTVEVMTKNWAGDQELLILDPQRKWQGDRLQETNFLELIISPGSP